MKRRSLYLFPLLIIVVLILSYSITNAKYQDSNTSNSSDIEIITAPAAATPVVATNPDSGIKPAATTPPTNSVFPIPILMYHEIGDGPSSLYVSVNIFRAQMNYLKSNNYNIVTMAQAREMLSSGQIPPKTAVITFDDGYVSVYTKAWPILQENGFTATVFVCSNFPGLYNYLTWDQIIAMHSAGVEIGSHSKSHPALTTISPDRITEEIAGSKQVLEEKTGDTVKSFCYPTGAYNQYTPLAVKEAGYTSAVTVVHRKATPQDDAFLIPRIRVFKSSTIASFYRNIN